MALAYLFEPTTQFQARTGANLTAGFLRVFYTQTDDPAPTYCDFAATPNEEDIVLDADGRAVVIVDDEKTYRLEVYNRNHGLLFTIDPLSAIGGAGGAGQVVTVESTDGSVDVNKTVIGPNTYFDLSTKVVMDEPLDWIKASISSISEGTVVPAYDEGTMYTTPDGVLVNAGRFYHTTTWLKAIPAGDGISYETLSVTMRLNGNTLWVKTFDIDNSLSDAVELEVSYDLDCGEDGYVDYEVTGISNLASVDLGVQFHRIFNGYSSEYAKKTWVENNFVQNSSLDMQSGTITGISGTPIGGIAEATVSSIASSYAESAASSKLDSSAFSAYTASALTGIQQDTAAISSAVSLLETSKVNQSAFDSCCSAVGAQVSALSSDVSAIRQDTGALSAAVSGLTGTYIQYADLESASGKITGISGTALWGGHEYTGIWPIVVDNTADMISAANKTLAVDETMTGYSSGDSAVIGVNTGTVLSGLTAYQTVADMTGYQPVGDYAFNSAVSAKLDASASSDFYSTSNPSGFLVADDITAKADASSLADYQPTSAMTAYQSAGNYLGPDDITGKADSSALTAYQPVGDYAYNSALSGYIPTSESSKYITSLAGYATEEYVDSSVSGKQDISGMTAYAPAGDYAFNSSLSGYIPTSESSKYVTSLAGYATEEYVDSSVSGKQDISAMTAYQSAGDYAFNSSLSGYIPTSESSKYITSLSGYATEEYVDSSVSGKQDISGMTAYAPAGDYQPSGDYIYESALGWAEV